MSRRSAAFMLSNFLHGEQGALMVAAQLVNAVPHMDGKFYAATQTLDEARHVEVFAAFIRKLDEVQPIAPALKKLLDGVLEAPSWLVKAVGMQVVTEGIALYSFRDMRNQTQRAAAQGAAHLRLARRSAPHRLRRQVPGRRGAEPWASRRSARSRILPSRPPGC